jgi:RND family efflux transporter MFP subunit
VTAPIDGYITALSIQEGGMASQAMPSAVITGIDNLEVKTSIAETFVDKLRKNDPVDVYVKAVSDEPFTGKIKAVVPAPGQGQTTYPVIISLTGEANDLKPGMFAEISMASDRAEDVVTIPSDAILIKSGEEIVCVLDNNDKVSFVNVETGLDNGELIEIVSGVSAGDRIVYEGQHYLNDESVVKVIE